LVKTKKINTHMLNDYESIKLLKLIKSEKIFFHFCLTLNEVETLEKKTQKRILFRVVAI
jgi:hypothetical protein